MDIIKAEETVVRAGSQLINAAKHGEIETAPLHSALALTRKSLHKIQLLQDELFSFDELLKSCTNEEDELHLKSNLIEQIKRILE